MEINMAEILVSRLEELNEVMNNVNSSIEDKLSMFEIVNDVYIVLGFDIDDLKYKLEEENHRHMVCN